MHEERDYLIKKVFPEVRQACRARQVVFTEIDLRWGVTAEEAEQGGVLRICLEEIDRCRPYFLSLLGERYGWSPNDGDLHHKDQLIRDFPFIESSLREGRSVTEMEILHGVLENPDMAGHSFFYFRDLKFTQSLALKSKRPHDFLEASSLGLRKLLALKEKIIASHFSLLNGYANLESLGNVVRADLLAALDSSFPEVDVPTLESLERIAHRAYAEDRSKAYIPNEDALANLDRWLAQSDQIGSSSPMVVTGASGLGKSSLLAFWISYVQSQSPSRFIIEHYAGITGDATPSSILYRIMAEIRSRLGVQDELPTIPDKILEAFPGWLARVRSDDPLLLVIDGLNQVDDDFYRWLPIYWPGNIKFLLSTLSIAQLEEFQKRQWMCCQVSLLDIPRRARLVHDYLAAYRKTLSAEQIQRIASSEQCANPLFLKLVLLELRIFGSFERLDQKISHLLSAVDPESLFELVLSRMEKDFGKQNVSAVMSAIACARKGLTESELLNFTGLSRLDVSVMLVAFEYQISRRSGHLGFFHDYLRQAVNRRYLTTPTRQRRMHSRLASYFEQQPHGTRRIEELPWQLQRAGKRRDLKNCLVALPMFEGIFAYGRNELLGYWQFLKETYDPGGCYRRSANNWRRENLSTPGQFAHSLNHTGEFLATECANYSQAEHFFLWARRELLLEHDPSRLFLAEIFGNLAVLRRDKGNYKTAKKNCEQAIRILEVGSGGGGLQLLGNLNVLAGLHFAMGEPARTERIYRRIIHACESQGRIAKPQLALAMNDLAFVLRNRGAYEEAESLVRQALDIREHLFGGSDAVVATSLNNLAELLRVRGQFDEASRIYERALQIRLSLLGPSHPTIATLLDNMSQLMQAHQRLDEAESMSRRAVQIRADSLGRNHTNFARGLTNLASILCDKNQLDEALELAIEALSIREKELGLQHPEVATTLCQLGKIYNRRGDYPNGTQALERAVQIRTSKLGETHPLLAESLFDLGRITAATGDIVTAKSLVKRALRISDVVPGEQDKQTIAIRNFYDTVLRENHATPGS